ncbi:MAG: ROK family glucokinase [Oscillospiraceae bacterium]|nr:ROK family glucokinase [Oscillospiraceae bacterium]
MRYGFGVDLGGTTVKLALFEETGTMVCKWEIPTVTENGGSRILPDIAEAIDGCMRQRNIDRSQVLGIGICVPGPVLDDGTVNRCVNLGWGVFNVENALQELTGLPVKAGNDANVAALGEYWMGGGKGFDSIVMVTLGTGVGGGIIIGGKLLAGAHGCGGEIGHMVLELDEKEPCGCGKYGCAEQYCSATGVVRLAKRYLDKNDQPSVLRSRELTAKNIFDAAAENDTAAVAITEEYYDKLARFLANLCVVADPEAIVIGGGVSKAGKVLCEGTRRYFDRYAFHAIRGVQFTLAQLGNDAGAWGAFKLALDAAR